MDQNESSSTKPGRTGAPAILYRRTELPVLRGKARAPRLGSLRKLAGAFALCLLLAVSHYAAAQVAASSDDGPVTPGGDVVRAHPIGNDTIVKMSKAGLDDTVIVQTIETQAGHYDTAPDDLIALKSAGVSGRVIAAMQARSAGLVIRHNDAGGRTGPGASAAAVAAGVDEIGVYYKDRDGVWTPLRTERVQFKSGGWAKSTFTNNIVKQDLNGYLDDIHSTLRLDTGVEILIYAPAGTQAEEYDLVRFRDKGHGREFRVKTGGVFHSETGSQRDEIEFHPNKIGPQMYIFTVPRDIEKGEYGVLPPGSSNTPGLSNAGKIFTFSIRE